MPIETLVLSGVRRCGVLAALLLALMVKASADAPSVELHWLEGHAPAVVPGTTWGVPWPEGAVAKGTEFTIHSASGTDVPVQSWPLAYWPDGSLKWTAHAVGADVPGADTFVLTPGKPQAPAKVVTVEDSDRAIVVDTGVIQTRIARSGDVLIESISRDGKEMMRDGRLVCLSQDQPDLPEQGEVRSEAFTGKITSVTVEQRGPVRAVIKIEGKHSDGKRSWLPFVVRLYFYAGAESIRVMHTITYDGDQEHDFIRGLGLRFSVPMRGAPYDRHMRFAGADGGIWAEAVQGLTGLRRDPGAEVRQAQVAGEATPPPAQWSTKVSVSSLQYIPAFGDFTLYQPTSDSFVIRKRTKEGFTWLDSAQGHRAAGLGWIGSPEGGVAFGIRNFWQSGPDQLDIRNAATDAATVTLWLWSPQAQPMDMRFHHDDMGEDTYKKQLEGLDITYEDYEPGFASAYGVARTSEMMLWVLPATPPRAQVAALADALSSPPQLVCRPADYKAANVFGGAIWNLADRSTPLKARIEDQLDFYFDYYKKEIDQRDWYGFWHFGNVMHTYDEDRHVWRYDVGGFAWDNSELSTDLWLWYDYLRSGRADIFRVAEAMSRHTGEVDVYHLGKFAGLGTRHGVIEWGDSAKQLRISTAENRRFLYFLTADERVGDLLHAELDAAERLREVPADRKVWSADSLRPPTGMVAMTIGTDWSSVAAAELTEWERTGDTKWRDKLVISMKDIAALPHGWFSGGGYYNPDTGHFIAANDKFDVSHLSIVFGGLEVNAELLQLLDVPAYEKTWLQYCELYNAGPEAQQQALGQSLGALNLKQGHSRVTAYAAVKLKKPELADRAWDEFLGGVAGLKLLDQPFPITQLKGPDVLNPIDETKLSTNAVNQWALAAIECQALVGDKVPPQWPR